MSRELRRADLRPGDVLLARGSSRLGSPISDWICVLDGGRYSHAAIWDGDAVLEASGDGAKVQAADVKKLICEHEFTDVYRFTRNGHRLGDPGWSAAPVLEVARSYVGCAYPYAQLCLLGVLVGLGRSTGLPQAQLLLRSLGGELARLVSEVRSDGSRRRPMTCSQFVGVAFWEADPAPERRYSLVVPYTPSALMTRSFDGELDRIVADCRTELAGLGALAGGVWPRDPARGHHGERAFGLEPVHVRAGDRWLPHHCLTPKDLEQSPTLRLVGALS